MRNIVIVIMILLASMATGADPRYGNTNQATAFTLDAVMPSIEFQHPTPGQIWEYQKSKGWRIATITNQPSVGCRVIQYGVDEIDRDTCRLTIILEKNIAEEQAEQAAREAIRQAQECANRTNLVTVTSKQLATIMFKVRNQNIPAQYQVSVEDYKAIISNELFNAP